MCLPALPDGERSRKQRRAAPLSARLSARPGGTGRNLCGPCSAAAFPRPFPGQRSQAERPRGIFRSPQSTASSVCVCAVPLHSVRGRATLRGLTAFPRGEARNPSAAAPCAGRGAESGAVNAGHHARCCPFLAPYPTLPLAVPPCPPKERCRRGPVGLWIAPYCPG